MLAFLRTLRSVFRLAFGGPANASIWNWWPLVVWLATGLLALFGQKIPHLHWSRASWTMLFLLAVALLLLRAAYLLQREKAEREVAVIRVTLDHGDFVPYAIGSQTFIGKYFHVTASVSRPVKNAGAQITRMRTLGGDRSWVDIQLLAPIPLIWVRERTTRMDLRPDREYNADLVFNQQHTPQVLIGTDSYEPRGVPFHLRTGRHELTVVIDCDDDVPSVTLLCLVAVEDEWDALNVWLDGDDEPPVKKLDSVIGPPPIQPGTVANDVP